MTKARAYDRDLLSVAYRMCMRRSHRTMRQLAPFVLQSAFPSLLVVAKNEFHDVPHVVQKGTAVTDAETSEKDQAYHAQSAQGQHDERNLDPRNRIVIRDSAVYSLSVCSMHGDTRWIAESYSATLAENAHVLRRARADTS